MNSKTSSPDTPEIDKEFRFAVVMYGGVSLAIYINGVAQELYKMVRASATKEDGTYFIDDPQGTEVIYRDLGKQLNARFVVDVLSGTSAGGINAVYLAKALANNQSMSKLEELWIHEGEITSLINDKDSIKDLKQLKLMDPAKSLLNSQRIYYELLYALQDMDNTIRAADLSPYVDELDLYVTSTDLRGLLRPIVLTDREAREKRFRAVFHFYYSKLGNEDEFRLTKTFESKINPFLAFVARATCALPAFEPANLSTIFDLDGTAYSTKDDFPVLIKDWNRFIRDYGETDQFGMRFFGDGGALDNKPFSYITETLLRRQSDVPIERRLFYIEPSPEHFKNTEEQSFNEPDMIENLLAQGVGLPRYETIREDLLQIRTRNDLIERTNNILRRIERTGGNIGNWKNAKLGWRYAYLDQLLAGNTLYGPGYAAYHQLRVNVALDDFATAVARSIGIPEESSTFLTLRQIVEGWRTSRYSSKAGDHRISENELLYRLDFAWRLRRLQFLLRIIDEIYQAINEFRTDVEHREDTYARDMVRNSLKANNENMDKVMWLLPSPEAAEQYRDALIQVKADLRQAYVNLRIRGRQLRQRNLALKPINDEDFQKDPELRAYREALQPLLALTDRITEVAKDKDQLEKIWEAIDELSLTLGSPQQETNSSVGYLLETFRRVARLSQDALATQISKHEASASEIEPTENIRACLQYYYNNFEYYDTLTFPIMYATPIGESANVKVYRISPEDAVALLKESATKRKLAGTKYGNFGAFFSEEWRRNDILWGQLDGAERIITTLLENKELQEEYQVRAWLAILHEKKQLLGPENICDLQDRFRELELRQPSWKGAWDRFEASEDFSSVELKELKSLLNDYFDRNYKIPSQPAEKTIIDVLRRSAQVLEVLLGNLAQKYPILSAPAALFRHLTRFVISLVPGNEGRRPFERWFKVAYSLEGFLLAMSTLFALLNGALLGFNKVLFWLAGISLLLTFIIQRILQKLGERVMKVLLSWL